MGKNVSTVKQYNKLVREYKEKYFNVYSFLVTKGWVVYQEDDVWLNNNNEPWFEWLLSPKLNELYKIHGDLDLDGLSTFDEEDVKHKDDLFFVDNSRCKTIIPPDNFVSNIDKDSNVLDIIKGFYNTKSNFERDSSSLLLNDNWIYVEMEDIGVGHGCECDEDDPNLMYLYLNSKFKEFFINKDNAYNCLKILPQLVVNSDLWWNYDGNRIS